MKCRVTTPKGDVDCELIQELLAVDIVENMISAVFGSQRRAAQYCMILQFQGLAQQAISGPIRIGNDAPKIGRSGAVSRIERKPQTCSTNLFRERPPADSKFESFSGIDFDNLHNLSAKGNAFDLVSCTWVWQAAESCGDALFGRNPVQDELSISHIAKDEGLCD